MNGAGLLAQSLKDEDVNAWFGMSGGHENLYLAVHDAGIKSYVIRHETNGALMADGYARASFKPGVCTAGQMAVPYLVAGMTEAHLSSIPVVAIVAQHEAAILDKHPHGDYVDHLSLFKTCTKWAHILARGEQIPEVVDKAFRLATSGRPGPVAVIVPNDLLSDEAAETKAGKLSQYRTLRAGPRSEEIARAAQMLVNAERPVIIAGGGVIMSQAWDELLQVAETIMAPVATTLMGKGSIAETHPLSAGIVGNLCGGENGRGKIANSVVNEADVILLLGTKTDQPSTSGWTVPRQGARLIHVDIDPSEIGRNYSTEIGIVTDAKVALSMLRDTLRGEIGKQHHPDGQTRVKSLQNLKTQWRTSVASISSAGTKPIRPERVMKELQNFIDGRSMVVADAGSVSLWAGNYLDVAVAGRSQIYPRGLTALGSGYPMALGAKVGAPEKTVISVHGDGAFGYTVMELETAARHGINVVSLVLNNKCLAWELWDSEKSYGRAVDCDFSDVRFDKIAEATGCLGIRVSGPDELKGAIRTAIDSNRPAVIDILTESRLVPPYG